MVFVQLVAQKPFFYSVDVMMRMLFMFVFSKEDRQ